MFKISTSEFGTVFMRRQMEACTDEFLTRVTEGVIHNVYKMVTWLSFGVTQRHKISGHFATVSQGCKDSFRRTGADFTKALESRFRLKFKTLVLNFVNRMLSLWS